MTIPQPTSSPRERMLFLGSGLVLLAAILLGLAREQHWGQRFVRLTLLTRNAAGIRPGQEVRISGMPVGQVQALELQQDAKVRIQLQLQERYAALIGPKSKASQGQEGFVGDHYLILSPDPQPAATAAQPKALQERTLPYEEPAAIASLINQLAQVQSELQTTLRHTSQLTAGPVPQALKDLRQTLDAATALSNTLSSETRTTGPQLRRTLDQVSRTGSSTEQTSAEAQRLLQDSRPLVVTTLQDLQQISATTRRLLQGLMGLADLDKPEQRP